MSKESKQVEWYRTHKLSLGMFDEMNYYVADITTTEKGDERLLRYHFFSTVDKMLVYAADKAARRKANSLHGYLKRLKEMTNEICDLVSMAKEEEW